VDAVHLAHAAAPERRDDFIVADPRARTESHLGSGVYSYSTRGREASAKILAGFARGRAVGAKASLTLGRPAMPPPPPRQRPSARGLRPRVPLRREGFAALRRPATPDAPSAQRPSTKWPSTKWPQRVSAPPGRWHPRADLRSSAAP
jgi:hypothetical protein